MEPREPLRGPGTPGAPASHPNDTALHLPSLRELAIAASLVFACMLAVAMFDEWRRPLQLLNQLVLMGVIVFFTWRTFWNWWSAQPVSIADSGVLRALGIAVLGWLDVALAKGVTSIPDTNYALIIIVPLAMMFGAFVSLNGLIGAGLGVAVVTTGLTRPVARRELLLASGAAAVVLNLAHIAALVRVYWRP